MPIFMSLTRSGSENLITLNVSQIKTIERLADGKAKIVIDEGISVVPEQTYMEIVEQLETIVVG